jgi:hypothetical protein
MTDPFLVRLTFQKTNPRQPVLRSSGRNRLLPAQTTVFVTGWTAPVGPLQPDGGDGRNNAKGCDVKNQIKKTYKGTDVPKDGNCPGGSHKVEVFADPNGGYHVQRQNSDGSWSEMSLGAGPGQTYPPRKCKQGKSPGLKDCGTICLPDGPKTP